MQKSVWFLVLLLVLLLGGGGIGLNRLLKDSPPAVESATVALSGLQAIAETFPEPTTEPLNWPDDHAAHPDQFAEYWLLAGLLESDEGTRHGFQLALFRLNLDRDPPLRASTWASHQVYRGQLVISEVAVGQIRVGERYSRAALGLSGSIGDPPRVWLEDWRIAFDATGIRINASDGDRELDLQLAPDSDDPVPITGPGYRGYWHPGLSVSGRFRQAERELAVSGRAMLDRLWGRALPVGRGQLALGRLWLEWDGGRALRCRQLQRRGGGGTPISECLLRRPDGDVERFERRSMDWRPLDGGWRMPGTIRYPLYWRLQLDTGPVLNIEPLFEDQALDFALPLWSGIVQPVNSPGWGLLELSNFAEP